MTLRSRLLSALKGNLVVSQSPYFSFVTGGLGKNSRTRAARAIPTKLAKLKRKGVLNKTPQARYAMYWFLHMNYGYDMRESEASGGVLVPPKPIGVSPEMEARIQRALRFYFVTGSVIDQ
jgi:hypothetical protein